MDTNGGVTTLEFKRIIFELCEHSPHTKIRLRLMGKMWDRDFLQVIDITGQNALILRDSHQMKKISINDVIQFELEHKFQDFKPNYHYSVGVAFNAYSKQYLNKDV